MSEGKERKWLQSNVPHEERSYHARQLVDHRSSLLNPAQYVRDRNMDRLQEKEQWDARGYFKELVSKKQYLDVLDSGAGWLELSRQLKDEFGGKLHVTALNPAFPIPPKQDPEKSNFLKRIRDDIEDRAGPSSYYESEQDRQKQIEEKFTKHLSHLKRIEENYTKLDGYRVSAAEDYEAKEAHDVIIDLWGPMDYSRFPERIMEVYFNAVKEDGRIIIGSGPDEYYKTEKFIQNEYSAVSERARKSGFYFTIKPLANRIFELNKVRLKK